MSCVNGHVQWKATTSSTGWTNAQKKHSVGSSNVTTISPAFSQKLVWCLGLFIPLPPLHFKVMDFVEVQRSVRHLEDHIQAILVLNYSSTNLNMICVCVCVLSARLSLELIECKVCLPCEVILEWVKLYKVHWNPWGLSASTAIFFDPPAWCGVARTLCAGDMETPFLGGEAPYWRWHQGDQGVWWVPLWPAFVASQLVLLGLT
jgi:hypothetical protein